MSRRPSDQLDNLGLLVRAAWPVKNADGAAMGAVIVSQYVSADLRAHARLATAESEQYQQLKVLSGPIQGATSRSSSPSRSSF